ncbi:heavy-metal-associated domain-containing protein [Sorangium sp. So ce1389]|uniref:heavy-metal-associated domain-containing protein n=1 Tax=Sorangium sp. So ce1389 TaxID=3133336 RepID=UPI003F5E79BD
MKETILRVDGMSCPSCVRHIDSALRELDGVDKVDVRLREGTVVVRHDPASAPVDALAGAVRGAGYDVRSRAA